ncbi:chaperone NapD [Shewanella algae]|uniref:chaperone NapD n=1 Tax=Shewanella algae TaxID=38313 RepID=UPI0031F51EAA
MKQQTEMEYHVTSLVVHAAPGTLETVTTAIQALEGAEVHASSPEGKLVVTLEGESQGEILDNVEAINRLPGILSSSLIYHQVDSEPVSQTKEIKSEETP